MKEGGEQLPDIVGRLMTVGFTVGFILGWLAYDVLTMWQ